MDGTYIYIEKSSTYTQQRRCYSMHKGRPLIKPMMITSTDWYIVSVLGHVLQQVKLNNMALMNAEGIVDWLNENDIYS